MVVAGLMASTLPAKKADAAVGVVIALTSQNAAMKAIGWDLAALGGVTALIGTFVGSQTQQCTPNAPCSCTTSNINDPSCVTDGTATTTTQCYNDYYNDEDYGYTECDSSTYFNGDQYSGSQTNPAVDGKILTIGLVLLGTDTTPSIHFRPLNDAAAKSLNLTAKQENAFNAELPKINLIANDFLTQIKSNMAQGQKGAQIQQFAKSLWELQAKPVLSVDAYSALQSASASYLKLMGAQTGLAN